MVAFMREQSRREGVPRARFIHWTQRKFGPLVIQRVRKDGQPGTSLPCVVCRKTLDRMRMPWRAHIDAEWVTHENAPPSKPTTKQRNKWDKRKARRHDI
jgi:hypothetical protein